MPYNTNPLVLHTVQNAAWLPGGELTYRTDTAAGTDFG